MEWLSLSVLDTLVLLTFFCFRHFDITYIFLQAYISFDIRKASKEVSIYKLKKKKKCKKKTNVSKNVVGLSISVRQWPLMSLGALPLPLCVLPVVPLLLLTLSPAPRPPALAIATARQSLQMEVPQLWLCTPSPFGEGELCRAGLYVAVSWATFSFGKSKLWEKCKPRLRIRIIVVHLNR